MNSIENTAAAKSSPAPEERERMIAEAAFFRAERRGFVPSGELEDWLQAEREIERLVAEGGKERA